MEKFGKLLRSPLAAHIVYFLESHFKSSGSIMNPHSLLLLRLAEFRQPQIEHTLERIRDLLETRDASFRELP